MMHAEATTLRNFLLTTFRFPANLVLSIFAKQVKESFYWFHHVSLSFCLPARNDISSTYTKINVLKASVAYSCVIPMWNNKQFAFYSYTHIETT